MSWLRTLHKGRKPSSLAPLIGTVVLLGCSLQATSKIDKQAAEGSGSYTAPPEGIAGTGRIPPIIITPTAGAPGASPTPEVIITPLNRDGGTEAIPGCGNGVLEPGEMCDPGQRACCNDTCDGVKTKGASCRASFGSCDAAELCDGTSADCASDAVADASTICRPAASSDCDVAEHCDGTHKECPADAFKPASTVCRAQSGDCDAAEYCTGQSAACPADAVATAEVVCRSKNGDCDLAESCDGVGKDCPADVVAVRDTVCRPSPSNALCDLPEVCDGTTKDCPPATTAVAPSGTVCRAAAGLCDLDELCDGTSTNCPLDQLRASGFVCNQAAGPCDLDDTCSGDSPDCSPRFRPSGYVCNQADGACDLDDTCSGESADCSPQFRPSGYICSPANGPCDVDDTCTGDSVTCASQLRPQGYVCNPANGPCDMDDTCTGSSTACPAQLRPQGYVCNAANGPCDIDDTCTGNSTTCTPQFRPNGYVCLRANGLCDVDDICIGDSPDCPAQYISADAPQGLCRPSTGLCDPAESCSGSSPDCPPDQRTPDQGACNNGLGRCSNQVCCPGVTTAQAGSTTCSLKPGEKIVFVSSKTYNGALGGLPGADDLCDSIAGSANLAGSYHAWLSTVTTNPGIDAISRMSGGPYVRVDGATIATDDADLVDGTLSQPINLSEWGSSTSVRVWTSTGLDGRGAQIDLSGNNACSDWATSSPNNSSVFGTSSATDGSWTNDPNSNVATCNGQSALYCFQACDTACKPGQSCIKGRCASYVFVTSTTVQGSITSGNFSGLQAADDICNTLAASAQLPGTYTAWLSSSTDKAVSRLVDSTFVRVDGKVVADNLAQLLGTSAATPLQNPIDLDENGVTTQVSGAWTATNPDGSANPASCTNWTSVTDRGGGFYGIPSMTNSQWTAAPQVATCDVKLALYCIETDPAILP